MSFKLKNKPKLVLDTNFDDRVDAHNFNTKQSVPKSCKNAHELKKINLLHSRSAFNLDRNQRVDKIGRLQSQKAQLLESLQILKNGAVSAIVEKDQIIMKLRKLFNEAHMCQPEDIDRAKVQELEKLLQYIKDLQEERSILKEQVEKQKYYLYLQIEEREQIISQLTNQLNQSVLKIENHEKYEKLLEDKIKVIEDSNENLSMMLNHSQETLKDERRRHTQENQFVKKKSYQSIRHASDSENDVWNPRSTRKVSHNGIFGQQSMISLCRSLDQSLLQSKIAQIKQQHNVQIQDLTQFYQSRIQTLKKLCENYPQTHYSTEKTNNSQKCEQNLVRELQDNNSNYSKYTNQIDRYQYQDYQRGLNKNFSLGSFKSGVLRMDPIDQRDEIQTPRDRVSLKKQLSSFDQSSKDMRSLKKSSLLRKDSDVSLSSKSSGSKQSQHENESQFSYKYFEYPNSNFKKNKNKSQLSQNSSELSSPTTPIKIEVVKNQKEKKKQQRPSEFWDKFIWFASGTITGGLLLSFSHKIIK